MKINKIVIALICMSLAFSVFSCAGSPAAGQADEPRAAAVESAPVPEAKAAASQGIPGAFGWSAYADGANGGSSRISLIEDIEMIGEEPMMTYTISGEITNQYEYGYAGWTAFPDDPTVEILKGIKSFSFKVIGDGQDYAVKFCINDVVDSADYQTVFSTRKDEEVTVEIELSSLRQPDWGAKRPFNQQAAKQIQFQTTHNGQPGTFALKIYGLMLFD